MVVFVAIESLIGVACPLTVIENGLRRRAGEHGYAHSFIGDWLDRLLYYDLPPAFFTVLYVAFGALVVALYVIYPPRRRP